MYCCENVHTVTGLQRTNHYKYSGNILSFFSKTFLCISSKNQKNQFALLGSKLRSHYIVLPVRTWKKKIFLSFIFQIKITFHVLNMFWSFRDATGNTLLCKWKMNFAEYSTTTIFMYHVLKIF